MDEPQSHFFLQKDELSEVSEIKSTYEEFLELQAAKAKKAKSESEKKSKSLEREGGGAKQVEEKPKFRKFSIFSKANDETPKTEDSSSNRPGKKKIN